jgi:hypothetical protein
VKIGQAGQQAEQQLGLRTFRGKGNCTARQIEPPKGVELCTLHTGSSSHVAGITSASVFRGNKE